MEGNQERNRKNNGEITENHKKLKLRMTSAITAGQAKQAIDNPTNSIDKPGKGKLVLIPIGLMTEAVKPVNNAIVENQKMVEQITDLTTTSGRRKLEEQSGGIRKIQSDGNQGSVTIQNGTIAVNQEKFIPRLTRSKTAEQAQQAPDNHTLPTNKPCEGKAVLIPNGLSMEAVEPDSLISENQNKPVTSMMRALMAGHSQETSDNITDLATMT
eukprot:6399530-Ditylum_brightwellii.AAC.1